MITCKSCNTRKSESEFYAHPSAKNGLDSTCKECRKEKARANRRRNIEYYKEYDRKRFQLDPRVRERHKRYQSTPEGKEASNKAKKRFLDKNPVKRAAHTILGNAIRAGKVKKSNACESCGISGVRINGHHDDYAFPLAVRWLCSACHTKWHKENGEGKNG